MNKLSINQWAEDDRPREKMMHKGAQALSNAELLAILVGSGSTDEDAVALMQRMLAQSENNLNTLAKWGLNDFLSLKGVGPAKAVRIMAALELGKRRNWQAATAHPQISSSSDIYHIFHPLLCDLPHEEFWLLLLNQAGKMIHHLRISQGGIDQTTTDIRNILREAIVRNATQIAVVHNHPSGTLTPSREDRAITDRLQKAAHLLNIRLTDHLIVTENGYYSFHDEGLL